MWMNKSTVVWENLLYPGRDMWAFCFLQFLLGTENWAGMGRCWYFFFTRVKHLRWVALTWLICFICKTLLFEFYWGFTKEYTFKNRRLTKIEPSLEDRMEGKNSCQMGWHVCVLGLDCHSPTSELSPLSRTFVSYTWAVTGKAIQAENQKFIPQLLVTK